MHIKLPICLFCVAHGLNDFFGGQIHYKGHWKRWALEMDIFLGPEMATSETHAHKTTNKPVFFLWALGFMILTGANSILGPWNFLKRLFWAQKDHE
jgi:hypothetical protein